METIGDAYIVAANLLTSDPGHAATVVRFALRAQQEAAKVPRPDMDDGSTLQMRIGEWREGGEVGNRGREWREGGQWAAGAVSGGRGGKWAAGAVSEGVGDEHSWAGRRA